MNRKYASLYERIVANTELAIPDDPDSCWLWKGSVGGNGYPRMSIRVPGAPHPMQVAAHRAVLEEVLDASFPYDEAGHLCYNKRCVNPSHLEVQTPWFNKTLRRGYKPSDGRMIPVLFPRTTEPPWLEECGVAIRLKTLIAPF